jgi:hypothetical protein
MLLVMMAGLAVIRVAAVIMGNRMAMIRMIDLISVIDMIVIEARALVIIACIGGDTVLIVMPIPIGVLIPIPVAVPIPIGRAIPVRVPRAIVVVALSGMMVTEAVMRIIARMVVTIISTLGVAESGCQQAQSGKYGPGD